MSDTVQCRSELLSGKLHPLLGTYLSAVAALAKRKRLGKKDLLSALLALDVRGTKHLQDD